MSQSKYDSTPTSTSTTVSCCSSVSAQLKLYQAFIFSVPIFFTFILLFFFYLFYLRRRRADWSSLRLRTARLSTIHNNNNNNNNNVSTCELGLKKEVREMLPIIVFKESFSVKDTQCSVCLGDYQAEDKLQQIPVCGHTFHMDCIDLWLATHTTCPLCRLSLLASRASDEPTENQANETDQSPESPDVENHDEGSPRSSSQPIVDPQLNQQVSHIVHQANETDCSPDSVDVENHDKVSPQCSSQPSEDPLVKEQIFNIVHREGSNLELAVQFKKYIF